MASCWPGAGGLGRLGLYWRTLGGLGVAQLAWRVRRKLMRAVPRHVRGETSIRTVSGWQRPVPRHAGWLSSTRWSCHGSEWHVPNGGPWSPANIPPLALYHLHYLDDLSSAAALANPGSHSWLIRRWITENRSGPAPAWDPYPVSRRLVNICKWLLAGGESSPDLAATLAMHADLLLRCPEYDLRANHLIANSVALVFAGRVLSGSLAERCASVGAAVLEGELRTQILADGGHYERSPMYHAVVLEDLLDVLNLLGPATESPASRIAAVLPSILGWLQCMTAPDGRIALFNDSAFDGCRAMDDLLQYAARLGVGPAVLPQVGGLLLLPQSGFARVRRGTMMMHADVGSVGPREQPGHAHAGTLSFELALGDRRVVVNSGTSTYERGPLRSAQRATRAHNTVEIDGVDSSEVWASFRVGRRARVHHVQTRLDPRSSELSAQHDGYSWLAGGPVHKRAWRLGEGAIEVIDTVASRGSHDVAARLHVHPDFTVSLGDGDDVRIRNAEGACVLTVAPSGWASIAAETYQYAPEFGSSQNGTAIVLRARTHGLMTMTTVIRT